MPGRHRRMNRRDDRQDTRNDRRNPGNDNTNPQPQQPTPNVNQSTNLSGLMVNTWIIPVDRNVSETGNTYYLVSGTIGTFKLWIKQPLENNCKYEGRIIFKNTNNGLEANVDGILTKSN